MTTGSHRATGSYLLAIICPDEEQDFDTGSGVTLVFVYNRPLHRSRFPRIRKKGRVLLWTYYMTFYGLKELELVLRMQEQTWEAFGAAAATTLTSVRTLGQKKKLGQLCCLASSALRLFCHQSITPQSRTTPASSSSH